MLAPILSAALVSCDPRVERANHSQRITTDHSSSAMLSDSLYTRSRSNSARGIPASLNETMKEVAGAYITKTKRPKRVLTPGPPGGTAAAKKHSDHRLAIADTPDSATPPTAFRPWTVDCGPRTRRLHDHSMQADPIANKDRIRPWTVDRGPWTKRPARRSSRPQITPTAHPLTSPASLPSSPDRARRARSWSDRSTCSPRLLLLRL